ncbi:2OG-Fe(II) oxygenase superfamily domain-containing protein [Ditylenchus destructor]|nr:2OG-Fe(II) oxygenase superfamily domain-containing protein [Ditylenchus destructor]
MKAAENIAPLEIMENCKASSSGSHTEIIEVKETTAFKRAFKFYRRRDKKPDLTNVLDLRVTDARFGIFCRSVDTAAVPSHIADLLKQSIAQDSFRPLNEWTLSTLEHKPGLYVLNNILTRRGQLEWLQRCLLQYPETPSVTNLTTFGDSGSNVFKSNVSKLRWVTMGNHYNWTDKVYEEKPSTDLPIEIRRLADIITGVLQLSEVKADAVILNYYPDKATLSPHVDRSERDIDRPLVSLSIGQSAVYLTGGTSLDDPVDAILLQSGDVLVMAGEQRLVYHGVPRILKTVNFRQRLYSCRVNITIRQVD